MKFQKVAALTMTAVTAIFAVGGDYDYSSRQAPTIQEPVANPPQLIVLGSDDNTSTEGLNWIVDYLASKKHADGTDLRMSFYSNTKKWQKHQEPWGTNGEMIDIDADLTLIDAHKKAYNAGHEVTNHTETHIYCIEYDWKTSKVTRRLGNAEIKAEIDAATEDLVNLAGVKKEHMKGFRTPYLAYSDTTYTEAVKAGFTYDCSINEGNGMDEGAYYWPYTLDTQFGSDNYSPGNENSYWNTTYGATIRKHSGYWVLPAYMYIAEAQDHDYIHSKETGQGYNSGGKITGLDWNLWAEANLNKEQSLRTLKNTLDVMYAGNRTPMTIGMHSQYYVSDYDASSMPHMGNHMDRREVLEKFIDYALAKGDDIYFVSGAQAIAYCMNPVPAIAFNPNDYHRPGGGENKAPTDILLSNNTVEEGTLVIGDLRTVDDGGAHTYIIKSGDFEVAGSTLKAKAGLGQGDHQVTIETKDDGGLTFEKTFTVKVVAKVEGTAVFNLFSWSISKDGIGSEGTHTATADKVEAKLTHAADKVEGTNTSYAYVSLSGWLEAPMKGVTHIEVKYSSDKDLNLGLSATDFGYTTKLAQGTDKTVKVAVSDFKLAWANSGSPKLDIDTLHSLGFESTGKGETNFTVTAVTLFGYDPVVVQKDTVDVTLGDWYDVVADTDKDSKVTIAKADNKLTVDIKRAIEKDYASIGLWVNETFNLDGVKRIELSYTATADFTFSVPMKGKTDNGTAHFKLLPATSEVKTLNFGIKDAKQPEWAEGTQVMDLIPAEVESPSIALANGNTTEEATGTIVFTAIKLIYVGEEVAVIDAGVKQSLTAPVVSGINNSKINLSVPTAGRYEISLYALNGQKIGYVESNLTQGQNNVSLNTANLGRKMVIVQITGESTRAIQKIMIK